MLQRISAWHERATAWLGGVSPLAPVAYVVVVLTLARIDLAGTGLLGAFLLVGFAAGVVQVLLTLRMPASEARARRAEGTVPIVAGLAAAAVVGVVGLAPWGFGPAWSDGAAITGVLVLWGVSSFVRMLVRQRRRPSPGPAR